MRTRPLAVLSALALAAVTLAGCSGTATPDASSSSGAADLCAAAAPSGAASDSISAEGAIGEPATATFTAPLEVPAMERTVLEEGDGEQLVDGDLVNYALAVFDAATGEKIEDAGYGDQPLLPVTLTAGTGPDAFFGCATIGSRVAMAVPAQDTVSASVWVLDVLGTTPIAAWGEPQTPEAGFPTVELADDGVPTVTIPDAAAPTDLRISVLKKGDGVAVAAGDTTLLQYYGVDWDTGESFDDSWSKGAPYSNDGNQYVPGFTAALEGQTVGSQILVVIPPALGYGEAGSSDHELAGKTLVFVIDVLATQHALPAQ